MEKQSKQGKVCYADLSCCLPIDKSFLESWSAPLPGAEVRLLTNGDFPITVSYVLRCQRGVFGVGHSALFLDHFSDGCISPQRRWKSTKAST